MFYTYNKGLLSSFYQEISAKLVQEGHEVVTVYLKNRLETFERNGIRFYGAKRSTLIVNYRFIFKCIKKEKPDIVVSNFGYINPALICGKLLGVKRNIAWFHTAYGHSRRHWFHVWFKKQCFNLADKIITNSKELSNDLNRHYGVPITKLIEIPFWTNIDEIEEKIVSRIDENTRGDLIIGCPGRLVKDKNHKIVIDALANISVKYSNWKLYLAGNGLDKDYLKSYINKQNLNDHIVFLGELSSQEMKTFYKRMDLVVLPSLHEAFGLVFLEAIALNTRVLVSNRFGVLEFLKEKDSVLKKIAFDPEDVSSLEQKLKSFFNKEKISNNNFKDLYTANFSKDKIYRSLKDVIFEH